MSVLEAIQLVQTIKKEIEDAPGLIAHHIMVAQKEFITRGDVADRKDVQYEDYYDPETGKWHISWFNQKESGDAYFSRGLEPREDSDMVGIFTGNMMNALTMDSHKGYAEVYLRNTSYSERHGKGRTVELKDYITRFELEGLNGGSHPEAPGVPADTWFFWSALNEIDNIR